MIHTCIALALALGVSAEPINQLRTDGVPVVKVPHLRAAFARDAAKDYPFKQFSAAAVAAAKANPLNWTEKGAVTPAKDQGPHGYCGTFGRVAAAEGQFALRSGAGRAVQFSEEALVDCVGWDQVPQQQTFFQKRGFMTTAAYPFNDSSYPDSDPPVPGNPCKWDQSAAVKGTAYGNFTDATGGAPNEDQLLAFMHRNGPVQTGIFSDVFGLREKNCEATGTCFITTDMCAKVKGKPIDHSITLVGYGIDAVQGPYWIVKVRVVAPFCRASPLNALYHTQLSPLTDHAELLEHCFCEPGIYQRGVWGQLRGHKLLWKCVHLRLACRLLRLKKQKTLPLLQIGS